ncbi:putative ribonuclease H-like domain-containing protein [Tanacetum coccineum]
MDLETAQLTTTAKLPTLKQGEYDMWRLRIEQYFQVKDYALWDVIENGNSFKPTAKTTTNDNDTSTTLIPGLVTTEEKVQKKNDIKARSMLLMALPNKHLMTFNQYKDAKTWFAAIQARFGGNEATKKTQKTLLKQMYENFSAPSTESLDSIFNRLQKIVSQLAILGENIIQEDLNLKFLRSLPSEWNTHVVVWRNKPDLDTMSFDNLYNNFKIVEQEVKGTASSSSSSSSQNMAFVSSSNNNNEVNTAYGVSTANTQVNPASTQVSTTSTQVSTANLYDLEGMDLKWRLALLSMRTKRFFQKIRRKFTINGSDTARYDKSKVEYFNCHKLGHFARECKGTRNQDSRNRNQDSSRRTVNVEKTSSKAMLAIDGAGFDWSYIADDEVHTNMALMDFQTLRDISYKDSEISVLKGELEKLKQEKESNQLKIEKFNNASKSLDKLIRSQIPDKSRKGLGFVSYNVVLPPPSGLFSPPNLDLSNSGLEEFQQPEFEGYGHKTSKNVCGDTSNKVRESLDAPMVKKLMSDDKLEKKTIFLTVAKIELANCNYLQRERVVSGNNYSRVNYHYSAKKAHPSAHKNIVPREVLMKTSLRSLNTARLVNTTHPKTTVYNARPMSCYFESTQSTVKRPYQTRTSLTNKNFSQKVNTAKGNFYTARPKAVNTARPKAVNTARPNSVVFNAVRENQDHPQQEDQGYVGSGCSRHMTRNMSYLSDFKEFDGGYVTFGGEAKGGKITGKGTLKTGLIKVPRKNNMYSVDMKNIVPKESLTCLVAKATLDELMLWHKRLGHVNFKTINKLVKENLVRGLPIKRFENDQTCVACLKGKQHKASFVTDDYSKFTWVFFLASKNETSGIFKSFITEIENLVDKKVKIIRSDNGTEFKKKVMSEFCEKKGIKREFSIARTPQQNGVAERRNRTLIEAAKTMLADSKLPTIFWAEAVNTACYVQNRVLVVKPYNKTPYELFRGRTPALGFMRPFGCHATILNTLDYLGKFDGKSDEGFFVGYSLNSKAFRVYIIRTRKVEESLHIRFLEDKPIIAGDGPKWLFDIDVLTKSMNYVPVVAVQTLMIFPTVTVTTARSNGSQTKPGMFSLGDNATLESTHAYFFSDETKVDMSNITTTYPVLSTPNTRIHKDHSLDHVIRDVQSVEPKKVIQALIDLSWIEAMQDELLWFKLQKARLVAQGYTQEEGIDYDEVFALVARIEAIRLFLAYASFKDFVVYQMDVNSAFLYGKIEEEVYVCQPPGFEDPEFPDRVYKVEKELYGVFLHQSLELRSETLSTYFIRQWNFREIQVTLKLSHLHAMKRIFKILEKKESTTGVNAGDSKLMLLDIHLLLPVLVNIVRHTLATASVKLMLPGIAYYCWAIVDSIIYATNVNSIRSYTSCIKQFRATAKAITVNWEIQIQALVDGKKAYEELGEGLDIPTDPQPPTIIQPSTSQPQKKQLRRKQRKDIEIPQSSGSTKPITDEAANEEHVPTHSSDPLRSEVTLVNEAQGRNDDNLMFDIEVLYEQEAEVEKVIKAAKAKAVTTASSTNNTTSAVSRPKARGVVV